MASSSIRVYLGFAFFLAVLMNINANSCVSKTYRPTTTYQYILSKHAYSNNEDCYFYFLPYSTYYGYFLEIQWYYNPAFSVNGMMPQCTTDYLEVFITSSYKSIGKYCSNNIGGYAPYTMLSHDGKAKIKFHSDSSGTGFGFQLRYRLRKKTTNYFGSYSNAYCYNTNQNKRSGIIYSSGYPRGYQKSSTYSCTHKISTGSNRTTKLVFLDLDLNYYGSLSVCSIYDDYVEVRGSDSSTATFSTSSVISGKMCTTSLIKTITTTKKYIFVYFRRPLGSLLTGRRGFYMGYVSYDLSVPTTPSGDCNFETNLCTWSNTQSGNDFHWTSGKGSTSSVSTGPSTDHKGSTTAKYIFIETSSPRILGHKAHLVSKVFAKTTTSGRCFTFWYHMYGSSIGKLNIYVRTTGSAQRLVWRLSGQQGTAWFQGKVNVASVRGTYTIIVEGVRGSSFTGDIAIDDFIFSDGSCATMPPKAVPATIATTVPPTTTPTPASGDCNFEVNLCTWSNTQSGDDFNWTSGKGSTSSISTGPSADHKGNTNAKYLFIETSSPRMLGHKAHLVSKVFAKTSSSGRCFTFWYHMYGSSIGKLNIYVKTTGLGQRLVWTRSGQQGTAWFQGKVHVTSVSGTYTIIIEGVRGSSFTGDIAIDDFIFSDGSCATMPTTVATTVTPTTAQTPTRAVNTAPFIIKHISGLCVATRTDGRLHLTSACNEVFSFTLLGALKYKKTSQCVVPESLANGAYFKLSNDCSTINARFQQTTGLSVKHTASGKCFHPEGGSSSPPINTKVVIYTGCNEGRLTFQLIYVNPTTLINTNTKSTQVPVSSKTTKKVVSKTSSLPVIQSSITKSTSKTKEASEILRSSTEISSRYPAIVISPTKAISRTSSRQTMSTQIMSTLQSIKKEKGILTTETSPLSSFMQVPPGTTGKQNFSASNSSKSIITIVVPVAGVILALLLILIIARYFYRSRKRPKIVFGDAHLTCSDSNGTNHYSKDPTKMKARKSNSSKDLSSSPPEIPYRPNDLNSRKISYLTGSDNIAFSADGEHISNHQAAPKMRSQSMLASDEFHDDVNPVSAPVNFENAPATDDDEYLTAVQAGVCNTVNPNEFNVPGDINENEEYIEMKAIEDANTASLPACESEEHYLDLTTAKAENVAFQPANDGEEHYLDLTTAKAQIEEEEDPESLYDEIDKFQKKHPSANIQRKPRSITFDVGPPMPSTNKPRSCSVDHTNMRHNASEPSFLKLHQTTRIGQPNQIPHSSSFPRRPSECRAPCPPPSRESGTSSLQNRRESAPVVQSNASTLDQIRNRKISAPALGGTRHPTKPENTPDNGRSFSRCPTIIEDHPIASQSRPVPVSQYNETFNSDFPLNQVYPSQGIAFPNTLNHQIHGTEPQVDQRLIPVVASTHAPHIPYYLHMAPAPQPLSFQAPMMTPAFMPGQMSFASSVPYCSMPYSGQPVAFVPEQGPGMNKESSSTHVAPSNVEHQQASDSHEQNENALTRRTEFKHQKFSEVNKEGEGDARNEAISNEPHYENELKHQVKELSPSDEIKELPPSDEVRELPSSDEGTTCDISTDEDVVAVKFVPNDSEEIDAE